MLVKTDNLPILFQDEWIVAINKPPGLLTHRSTLASDRNVCQTILRDQIGTRVFPAHRLDRKTSGILLFTLDSETLQLLNKSFAARHVEKKYLAIVRGWILEEGIVDDPLKGENGKQQTAKTMYRPLNHTSFPDPVGPYPNARYSLIELTPHTGRLHQIRRHMNHISHPIIGDTTHGDGRHNRYFREKFGYFRMFLHASKLSFQHPKNRKPINLSAPLDGEFKEMMETHLWKKNPPSP